MEMELSGEDLDSRSEAEVTDSTEGTESLYEENGVDSEASYKVYEDECNDFGDVIGLTSEGIMQKLFRSEDGAYEFYKRFGKCHGFAIRKGDFYKDDSGKVIRRRFFCNRAGVREAKHYNRPDRRREHKPETRTNCKARLSIYLDSHTLVWRVRKVVMEHNHDLTPAGMIHMMPNFRSMTDSAKAQIKGLHGHGVTTSKILGYIAGQAGGYSFVGFNKKDAYNYVQRSKTELISDGDLSAAIGYLEGKVTSDPMSTARYLLTEDNMLANMLWADGGSRIDYQFFGDVLAFDLTHKKNKYCRPLVIFLGSNNHKQTSIFGFGLLKDETMASYKWLLENFVESMCNRKPSVVVSDGDDAMKAAMKAVMPEATHRLCAWHMEKNVTTNVKWDGLRSLFRKWLYADMGIQEFEYEWEAAMAQYQTGDRFWFRDTYEKRRMWANAYLRDKFCAGFRTTSRCEGINVYVKKFVKSRNSILEMLHGLELMVMEYRNNELEAQFRSLHGFPVMTTGLEALERFATTVYTREIFFNCKKEIEGVVTVNIVSRVRRLTTMIYTLEGYTEPGRQIRVLFERNSKKFQCDCCVWNKKGFPCRHMLFVMKHEHLTEIPDRLVLKRWRKDAKCLQHYTEIKDEGSERSFLMRHGALHSASQRLVFVGAKTKDMFDYTLSGLVRLRDEVEGRLNGAKNVNTVQPVEEVIKDPVMGKTKGAPKVGKKWKGKKRKCSNCRMAGHTKRHCRKNVVEDVEREPVTGKGPSYMGTQSNSYAESVSKHGFGRDDATGDTLRDKEASVNSPDVGPSDEYLQEIINKISTVGDQLLSRMKKM